MQHIFTRFKYPPCPLGSRSLITGNLLLSHSSGSNSTIPLVDRDCSHHVHGDRCCDLFFRISTTGILLLVRAIADWKAAAMTVFLGPFGFLAAVVAVVVESWMFVKIFVASFLIKGMIGEEVFEAVEFPNLFRC